MKTCLQIVSLAVAGLTVAGACAAQSAPALPQGPGLAARYPGESGIARDSQVLLHEDFESGSIEDFAKRWESVSNDGGRVMAFSDSVAPASAGRRSLQMTATLGENSGGHLYKRLSREVDRAFARFYVKFAPENDYTHHFVHFGGYRPSTSWPQGGAGERPRGDERITVGIEPFGEYGKYPPPGAWFFYAYWHEMKVSADGKYWGNGLRPAQPQGIPKDTWQCVELMLQLNSAADKHDGELALWLDGKLVAHFAPGARRGLWSGMGFTLQADGGELFEGFNFRTNEELKINFFWLLDYVTKNAARQNNIAKPNPINRVWFDDIIVATSYIGPAQGRKP